MYSVNSKRMNLVLDRFYQLYGITKRKDDSLLRNELEQNIIEYNKNKFDGSLSSVTDPKERSILVDLVNVYNNQTSNIKVPKDVMHYMALNLDLKTLLSLCLTDKKYNRICNDDIFWMNKLLHDYPKLGSAKYIRENYKKNRTWKQYYEYLYSYLLDKNLDTKLMDASNAGLWDLVIYLVEQGADIHAANDFALIFAAEKWLFGSG